MTKDKLNITPRTKIAELLSAYPELEDALIDMAPALEKLGNPALRETIARVTSLSQAASVGEIPVEVIVNKLRGIVGQSELDGVDGPEDHGGEQPDWLVEENIKQTYDARESIAMGGHPVSQVLGDLNAFAGGQIYELITPFLPAPLLDKVGEQGFEVWTKKISDSEFRNYFYKD